MNYILSSYAALETVNHRDLTLITQALDAVNADYRVLPQTVLTVMSSKQWVQFTANETELTDDKNVVTLHRYE